MNSKSFYVVAALATLAAAASTGVFADEVTSSDYTAVKTQGQRSRAEVQADLGKYVIGRSTEPAGSRVAPPMKSALDAATRRAQTAEAVRRGDTSRGETGRF